MKKILSVAALLCAVSFASCSVEPEVYAEQPEFLPLPVEVTATEGEFVFSPKSAIDYSADVEAIAIYLDEYLGSAEQKGKIVKPGKPRKGAISLSVNENMDIPAEGYRLTIEKGGVVVEGKDYGGVFNGVQTLLQVFPAEVYAKGYDTPTALPAMMVEDYPRFEFRGQHLDIARTFMPKEEVMRFIDNIAYHKINTLHWHLSDDQGWRVEIKSHPELAEVGGFRGGDSPVKATLGAWDEKYGGYFTQDDIREVIEYAAVRNIEIIPEIDLPGHSLAAANVHPEILCSTSHNGNVWCASREENYELLGDVLTELAALFPSKYFHLGGDEVNMSQWMACPECRELMRKEGLKSGHELEGYFLSRLVKVLEGLGKTAVVWNEAINGDNLTKDVLVSGWEDVDACLDATAKGYKTIVMPAYYFYFDMKQSAAEPGFTWANTFDVKTTYSFEFDKLGFTPEQMKNVYGVQGAFWSEVYLSSKPHYENYLDYQTFPRVCGLSEVAWTQPEKREWTDFEGRLTGAHYKRMDNMGILYRAAAPEVEKVKYITPAVKFSSSMTLAGRGEEVITKYKIGTNAHTTKAPKVGDWFLFTFDNVQEFGSVEVITGYTYFPDNIFTKGIVEVSADGVNYTKAGDLLNGRLKFTPSGKVKAIKVTNQQGNTGMNTTYFQALQLTAN